MAGYLFRVYHTRASTQLQSMTEATTSRSSTRVPHNKICMPRQNHHLENKKFNIRTCKSSLRQCYNGQENKQ